MYSTEEIRIPSDFNSQVYEVKQVLQSDTSGIVNSMLDFAISSANVSFNIETDNQPFGELINTWFSEINSELVGKIPIGIKGLQREYYRERWKSSSLIVLRTEWNDVDVQGTKFYLPTRMWIADGQNIEIKDSSEGRTIGNEEYRLKINDKKSKPLPGSKDELIFIQKPFNSWNDLYPTPFLIQRGLYKNLKLFDLLSKRGEKIIARALEYMLVMKKGNAILAQKGDPNYVYTKDDLVGIKEDLGRVINESKSKPGTPTYVTNFDTDISELIPDYKKAMNTDIYSPIEKRLLAGLGAIEIVEGTASSRREAILSPKPFVSEVEKGVNDFITLLDDVIYMIRKFNYEKHRKYFGSELKLHYSPIKEFISDSIRNQMTDMYDRGILSKETYGDIMGPIDIDVERTRRTHEYDNGDEKTFYPPIIQNVEGKGIDMEGEETIVDTKANIEPYGGLNDDFEYAKSQLEFATIVKRKKGYYVLSEKTGKSLGGPYKTYRQAVKRLRQIEYFKHQGDTSVETLEEARNVEEINYMKNKSKLINELMRNS
jgi:hypothetical protein